MSYAFISYSRQDKAYVQALAMALSQHALGAWYDVSIEGGDNWWGKITQKIEDCGVLVVIMTPEAEASVWVERELLHADSVGKPIVPLLLRGQVFDVLANVPYYDVRGGDMPDEEAFEKLASLLPDDIRGDTELIDPAIIAAALAQAESGVIHDALWYSEQHVWLRLNGNYATIGVTDFGQKHYGVVAGVELPPHDSELHLGSSFAAIQTNKHSLELASPVLGQVLAINAELRRFPQLVNAAPYEQGWLIQARVDDTHGLMSAAKYARYCKSL